MTAYVHMLSKIFRTVLLAPALYWFYLIFSGNLGADPAKQLNHMTGEVALYFLLLNLVIGILISFSVRFPKWARFLLTNRRFLGVTGFVYLIFHVLLYLTMEGFEAQGFIQIYTKTYLIFGASAWLILLVLALTSNDRSVRLLGGRRWKNLHRAVYAAALLVTVHVLLIEKSDLIKYGSFFAVLWIAMLARFWRTQIRNRWVRASEKAKGLSVGSKEMK